MFRLHGFPKYIVSDQDTKFLSAFWQELFRLASIELTPSTSYCPLGGCLDEDCEKFM